MTLQSTRRWRAGAAFLTAALGASACGVEVSGLLSAAPAADSPDASSSDPSPDAPRPADAGRAADAVAGDDDARGEGDDGDAPASLVASYRFEGSVTDDSPHHNDPTALGVISFVPGKQGQAVRVTRDSAIVVPNAPSFNVRALTIEVWIRPRVISQTVRAGLFDSNGRYGVFLLAGGVVQCSSGAVVQGRAVPVDTWTHVACVNDGASISVYVDGVLIASSVSAAPSDSVEASAIGANSPSGDPFDGDLDTLRVWSVARTPAQIRASAGLL